MLSLLKILLSMLYCAEFERWRKEVERLPEKITQKVLKIVWPEVRKTFANYYESLSLT